MKTTNKGLLLFNSAYAHICILQCVATVLMSEDLYIKISQEFNVSPQVTATK